MVGKIYILYIWNAITIISTGNKLSGFVDQGIDEDYNIDTFE
jgi:hypothetical protein